MDLINYDFQNKLQQYVINDIFPNLRMNDKKLISELLINILKIAGYCYGFGRNESMVESYRVKLSQNNYKDVRWMIRMLLPYIDDQLKNINEINSFDQIYKDRKSNVDINLEPPLYNYTNIQYDRCTVQNGEYQEISYNEKHLRDNYYLLIESIMKSRYKLSVNWIDIVPVYESQYQELDVYKNTMTLYDAKNIRRIEPMEVETMVNNLSNNPINQTILNSIGLDDIYNTISLNMYEQIVRHKWMLFDIFVTTNGNARLFPLIIILGYIIDLSNCIHNRRWEECEDENNKFKEEWEIIVNMMEKEEEQLFNFQYLETVMGLSYDDKFNIIRPIVMFFDKMYNSDSDAKDNKYIPLKRNPLSEEDDTIDQENMNNITNADILKTLKSIDVKHIYEFFKNSIEVLKSSWYGSKLIVRDKDGILGFEKIGDSDDNRCVIAFDWVINDRTKFAITYKNVYNYCKSFVHEEKSFVRMGRYFSELSAPSVQTIEGRINRTISNWFDISGNLRNVYEFPDPVIRRMNNIIYTYISEHIIDIIFEQKIRSGVFTQFIDANKFTDNSRYDQQNKKQQEQLVLDVSEERRFLKKDSTYENAYYFMTNQRYKELPNYRIELEKNYNYFNLLSDVKFAWYLAAAYHWVAQIGFVHHYINNRITFLTAGTGVGKSTEIPKLYCYYLKAVDHIPDATVLITVPRTGIIITTGSYVARCMGTPIKSFDEKGVEKKTQNYSIQYKYKGNPHRDFGYYPKIIFMTDGSFPLEAKDPLMKKKNVVSIEGKRTFVYNNRNLYDIILIDESHEHNANMDIILTLMRNICMINNMMKLVIISATIAADEPIYRRFYREINDNRKYPYNRLLDVANLDRMNVDRRYDIQIPGQKTKFPIFEEYLPNATILDTIREICTNTSDGDILVFQPGQSDIRKLINKLNNPGFLQDNVIAVPYYSEMTSDLKEIVGKMDKNIRKIKINKSEIFELSDPMVGDSSYTRFIMVATNIAEASITIDSLRYVVETGKQKTMVYDYEKRGGKIKEEYINEASRLQRKGRVGRTASGKVYYLYSKGKLASNKKQYNISIQDIHISIMYEYLRDHDDIPLFNPLIHRIINGIGIPSTSFDQLEPLIWQEYIEQYISIKRLKLFMNTNTKNSIRVISEKIVSDLKTRNILDMTKKKINTMRDSLDIDAQIIFDLIKSYINSHGHHINSIIQMIRMQYIVDNNAISINTNTNNKVNKIFYYYSSGYDIEQLVDSDGSFYIIHPDELNFRRNIGGVPVESLDESVIITNNRIESQKILTFWETLLNKTFIDYRDDVVGKSSIGATFMEIIKSVTTDKIDESVLQIIAWGVLLLDEHEISQLFGIIAMLYACENQIRNIFIVNEKKRPIDKYLKMFSDQKSDLMTIHNLITTCDKLLTSANLISNFDEYIRTHHRIYFDEFVLNITPFVKTDNYLENRPNGKSQFNKEHQKYLSNKMDPVRDNRDNTRDNTRNDVLARLNINTSTYVKFIGLRNTLNSDYAEYKFKNDDSKKLKIDKLSETKKIVKPLSDYLHHMIDMSPIDAIFLWSKQYSVYKKIPQATAQYMSLYNPYGDSIYSLTSINPFRQVASTTIDPVSTGDYIFSMSVDPNTNTLGILCRVTTRDLMILSHIYNPKEMTRKYFKKDNYVSFAETKIMQYRENNKSFEKKKIFDPISLGNRIYSRSIAQTMLVGIHDNLIALSNRSDIWKIMITIHPNYIEYAKLISSGKIE